MNVIELILDQARWAPSGDNTQPWQFQIIDDHNVLLHGRDTRSHCVYDLDGHPSQIAIGALIETMAIAATAYSRGMTVERLTDTPAEQPTFRIRFVDQPAMEVDSLARWIQERSVQRRAMQIKPLTAQEKASLEASVAENFDVVWLEGWKAKSRAAHLMFTSAKLRLTMPEAYETHRAIIEWNARHSLDKVPDQALGIDPLTTRVMRFAMKSWNRVSFFNRFLAGTWAPRLQMDLIPALGCAAHFVLQSRSTLQTIDDYVAAGRAIQRFWLTVTQLGLQMQPELTPLIFSRYARDQVVFSQMEVASRQATAIKDRLQALTPNRDCRSAAFMGRVGSGRKAWARSLRKPLPALVISDAALNELAKQRHPAPKFTQGQFASREH